MIEFGTAWVLNSFVNEGPGASVTRHPLTYFLCCRCNLSVHLISHLLFSWAIVDALGPFPSIWGRKGAPWRFGISRGTTHVMCTLIINLGHTATAEQPLTTICIQTCRLLRAAITDTITPMRLGKYFVIDVLEFMLAPRCIRVDGGASMGGDTFVLEVWCTGGGRRPGACVLRCRCARASKLTLGITPSSKVKIGVLCRICIGWVEAVILCDIALHNCPGLLSSGWLMSHDQWSNGLLIISHAERKGLIELLARALARLTNFRHVPALPLCHQTSAWRWLYYDRFCPARLLQEASGVIAFFFLMANRRLEAFLHQRTRW